MMSIYYWYLTDLGDLLQRFKHVTHKLMLFRQSDGYLCVTRCYKWLFGMYFGIPLAINYSPFVLLLSEAT
jgi:hypothetical protein